MKNVSKVIALAVIVAAFASCGTSRKSKQKQEHKLEEYSKKDSIDITKTTSIGEVKEQTVKTGKVTIDRQTTTVLERGGTTTLNIKKGDVKPGINYLKDTAGNIVIAIFDSIGQTLRLDLNTPPERITKTTNEQIYGDQSENTTREEKNEEQQKKKVAVAADSGRKESLSSSSSETKPDKWAVFLRSFGGWIGLAVGIIIVAWWFFGRSKK